VIDGGVDGVEALDAEVLPAFLVVSAGEAVLGVRFVFKSSTAASSRLASHCAATSARSLTGKAKACCRSSCARGDIGSSYRDTAAQHRIQPTARWLPCQRRG
jgi:hypothetical protein